MFAHDSFTVLLQSLSSKLPVSGPLTRIPNHRNFGTSIGCRDAFLGELSSPDWGRLPIIKNQGACHKAKPIAPKADA